MHGLINDLPPGTLAAICDPKHEGHALVLVREADGDNPGCVKYSIWTRVTPGDRAGGSWSRLCDSHPTFGGSLLELVNQAGFDGYLHGGW